VATIAVTGAGGMLGRCLIDRLLARGHAVIAFSRSLPAADETPLVVRWSMDWDETELSDHLRGVDTIIHAAAHIPRDMSDPKEALPCLQANALTTLNLLRAAELCGVRRFLYVSSANALRPSDRAVVEDDPPGGEHAPYYLGSKLLAEIYVKAAGTRGLSCLVVRPSSIYGPGMVRGVLLNFATQLRAGRRVIVNDGGRFHADFVWRDDVAYLITHAAESDRVGALNVGSGEAHSLLQVATRVSRLLQADPTLVEVEPADETRRSFGFAPVDISRARDWYNFQPTSLDAGLRQWLAAPD
jgi:UDP-glucose 4-epimerase